ncbi:MAG: trypsin-like serine peptidase [Planctomycetota bacterium]
MRKELLFALATVLALVAWAPETSAPATDLADSAPLAGVRYDVSAGLIEELPSPPRSLSVASVPGWNPGLPDAREPEGWSWIFGSDDRIRVYSSQFPYSTVCWTLTEWKDGEFSTGSAVLVGRRLALTAGHIVYSSDKGGYAKSVKVVPAYDNGSAPYGEHYGTRFYTLNNWINTGQTQYDFGAIELSSDVGSSTGWLGFSSRTIHPNSTGLNMAGYPGDLENGEGMYWAYGVATTVTDRQLFYRGTLDAWFGNSGSGIWVYDESDESRFVVGIHVAHASDGSANTGTRINNSLFNLVKSWVGGTSPPPGPSPDPSNGNCSTVFWTVSDRKKRWNKVMLGFGQCASGECHINSLPRFIKIKIKGRGRPTATLISPSGWTYYLKKGRTKIPQSETGTWTLMVRADPDRPVKRVKVLIKPKY